VHSAAAVPGRSAAGFALARDGSGDQVYLDKLVYRLPNSLTGVPVLALPGSPQTRCAQTGARLRCSVVAWGALSSRFQFSLVKQRK